MINKHIYVILLVSVATSELLNQLDKNKSI